MKMRRADLQINKYVMAHITSEWQTSMAKRRNKRKYNNER
jgi:hypothetical protein